VRAVQGFTKPIRDHGHTTSQARPTMYRFGSGPSKRGAPRAREARNSRPRAPDGRDRRWTNRSRDRAGGRCGARRDGAEPDAVGQRVHRGRTHHGDHAEIPSLREQAIDGSTTAAELDRPSATDPRNPGYEDARGWAWHYRAWNALTCPRPASQFIVDISSPDTRPLDTSPEAHRAQIEIYRRMGPEGRAAALLRLNGLARALAIAGIRSRHPDYDDTQANLAYARLVLGDEWVVKVWPGHALVAP
jgi:hypothetical protein